MNKGKYLAHFGAVLAGILSMSGCCNHKHIVHEGVVLLRNHEHPDMPFWEERRQVFLKDAEESK